MMSKNAQGAFDELKKIGALVFEWGEAEGYADNVAFVMIWANEDSTEIFADSTGRYIKERTENGKVINPLGYRQDVHEIFKKYGLVTDWESRGQLIVFDDQDAPGYSHWH